MPILSFAYIFVILFVNVASNPVELKSDPVQTKDSDESDESSEEMLSLGEKQIITDGTLPLDTIPIINMTKNEKHDEETRRSVRKMVSRPNGSSNQPSLNAKVFEKYQENRKKLHSLNKKVESVSTEVLDREIDETVKYLRSGLSPKSFLYIDDNLVVMGAQPLDIDIEQFGSEWKVSFMSYHTEVEVVPPAEIKILRKV